MAMPDDFQAVPEPVSDTPETPELLAEDKLSEPLHASSGREVLKRGSWIEYSQGNGIPTRARLLWISPLKGIYLFTNRQGQRAISITAEGLERKLRCGDIKVIDDASLIDRAVDRMMARLSHNAA
jgi:hypothetical protein